MKTLLLTTVLTISLTACLPPPQEQYYGYTLPVCQPKLRHSVGYPVRDYEPVCGENPPYWPNQTGRMMEEDGLTWDRDYNYCVNKVFPLVDAMVYNLEVGKLFQSLYVECMNGRGYHHVDMF